MTSQPAKNKLVQTSEIQGIVKPNKGFILSHQVIPELIFAAHSLGDLKQAATPSAFASFSIW